MRNVGAALIIAAYLVLLFTSSVGVAYMSDAGIGLTQARWHVDPMMLAIAIAGTMLALVPVRRGERWAQVTQVVMLISVLTTRFDNGAKRLVLLDSAPQGHGFLIVAFVLAIAGLAFSSPFNPWAKSSRTARTDAGRV
jgi:hypothetical protein